MDSLEDLKAALVENLETLGPSEGVGIDERTKNLKSQLMSFFSKAFKSTESLPQIGGVIRVITPFFFQSVRDQLICIDDLDRRGKNLQVRDIFGLVSFLKEERNCKIIILSNKDQLGSDGINDYMTHVEKVVDVELTFSPTPLEAAEIALPANDTTSAMLKEHVVKLGIKNIRVIQKIERLVQHISPLILDFDPSILRQASHSLTLFGWSKYQPENAPPLDFLKSKVTKHLYGLVDGGDMPDEEVAWVALLEAYQFTWTDEFDRELIRGVEKGYFDPQSIHEIATKMSTVADRERRANDLRDAWKEYHDSFADNETEALNGIFDATRANIEVVTQANLDSTVRLFKELNRAAQAQEILAYFVANRSEPQEFWDIKEHGWPGDVNDPDVIETFSKKLASFGEAADPLETFHRVSKSNGWNNEDLKVLASLSVDQYREIFKSHNGDELNRLISYALGFFRVANANQEMMDIANKAKEALAAIGRESDINARRVRKYGIVAGEK